MTSRGHGAGIDSDRKKSLIPKKRTKRLSPYKKNSDRKSIKRELRSY